MGEGVPVIVRDGAESVRVVRDCEVVWLLPDSEPVGVCVGWVGLAVRDGDRLGVAETLLKEAVPGVAVGVKERRAVSVRVPVAVWVGVTEPVVCEVETERGLAERVTERLTERLPLAENVAEEDSESDRVAVADEADSEPRVSEPVRDREDVAVLLRLCDAVCDIDAVRVGLHVCTTDGETVPDGLWVDVADAERDGALGDSVGELVAEIGESVCDEHECEGDGEGDAVPVLEQVTEEQVKLPEGLAVRDRVRLQAALSDTVREGLGLRVKLREGEAVVFAVEVRLPLTVSCAVAVGVWEGAVQVRLKLGLRLRL